MKTIQVTLFSKTGKYKPISTTIDVESLRYYVNHKEECQTRAITKMCAQRKVDGKWLAKYGYTKIKVREFEKKN